MASLGRANLLDLLTTICLFIAGLAGLYQALQFPDRAGMWPTFVMVALVLFVGIHLVNLIRQTRHPVQDDAAGDDVSV